jgi:hypothetical protein
MTKDELLGLLRPAFLVEKYTLRVRRQAARPREPRQSEMVGPRG